MKSNLKSLVTAAGTMLLSTLLMNVNAASVGISPAKVFNENLAPGSVFEKEIVIVREDPSASDLAKLVIDENNEISSWIEITEGTEIVLPEGEQQVRFPLKINVPPSADYGEYKGKVAVEIYPTEESGNGNINIRQTLNLELDLEVTDETIEAFEVRNIQPQTTKIHQNRPVLLDILAINSGNKDGQFSEVELTIKNLAGEEIATYIDDTLDPIPAFVTETIIAELNHSLEQGQYYGNVNVKVKGKSIGEGDIQFDVIEPLPDAKETNANENLDGNETMNYAFWGIMISLVLVIAIMAYLVLKNKKKQ